MADPIPIESLTPISKSDPRTQINFDGKTLPRTPGTRRVRPKPFQRQRIDLDRHGRAWQYIRADQVSVGEMVVGVGRVAIIDREMRRTTIAGHDVAVGTDIVFTSLGGTVLRADAGEQVRTFARAEENN